MKTKTQMSTPLKVASKMFSKTIVEHPNVGQRHLKKVEARYSTKRINIFLVDDDTLFLKALEHAVSEEHPSLNIKTFKTGEACLEQIKQNPDIVVLDFNLNTISTNKKILNGLDVLKKIKKASPKTKVIMLSAQDSLDIAMKCIDSESYDYISKNQSAIIKLNNIIGNIVEEIELNSSILKPYQIVLIIFILILIVEAILY
jgi:two-component system OmpR family response regulator